MPVESPICVPLRPVLHDLSVEQQLRIKELDNGLTLTVLATNDATLKGAVVLLERLILAHDEPLGSCD